MPIGRSPVSSNSVGCPVGCNFCATSAMFGGKGRWIDFYRTGDELFDVMCRIEAALGCRSFFVMDENFLFHRRRALRLLELMRRHDKSWSLYVFSSARVVRSYTIEQLVGLGVSWIWMGVEGEDSQYAKLDGVDTFELVRRLQSHGIRVLGATIIGLESELILRAFRRDFSVNGPSMLRVVRTTLAGWKRYKNHPDPRIRRRFGWEVAGMATKYAAVVGAVKRYYRTEPGLHAEMSQLLEEICGEFGWTARLSAALGGPFVLWKIRQEERRLARGWTYEPPTFYEVNEAAASESYPGASRCRYVTPGVVSPQEPVESPAETEPPETCQTPHSC